MEAIESILNQTYKNYEIIIIDDGSEKSTKEILNTINLDCARVLFQKNKGPAAARNVGIEKAKGDYIVTLDADDTFKDSFIEKAVDILNNYEEYGMVTCWGTVFLNNKKITEIRPSGGDWKEALFGTTTCAIGNLMFKRKLWEVVGGYDEHMRNGYEDWEFYIACQLKEGKTYVIEDFLFNYRDKPKSRNKIANKKHKLQLKKYVFKKYKELCNENFEVFIDHIFEELKNSEYKLITVRNSKQFLLGKKISRVLNFMKLWK